MGKKIEIIAEIGENFIGNMDIAMDLIEKAGVAGADWVKFQSYRGEDFKDSDPEKEWFKKVTISDDDHFRLKERAEKSGIGFMSSPFTVERAKFLIEKLGLRTIKVASGVMLNLPILDYINGSKVKRVILSTGLSTLPEIKKALSRLKKVKRVDVLHCVTQYPCRDEETNLLAIQTLKKAFKKRVIGYSDHTLGYDACIAAAALGAEIIEKHYTFDKNAKEGTDHEISVEPGELAAMVGSIRRIEEMTGSGKKLPTAGERKIKKFVRGRF